MKSLLQTVVDAVAGWGLESLLGPKIMGFFQSVFMILSVLFLFYAVWFVYAFFKDNDKPKNS